jgi:hypothetical protein
MNEWRRREIWDDNVIKYKNPDVENKRQHFIDFLSIRTLLAFPLSIYYYLAQ